MLSSISDEILSRFPVRKKRAQKAAFRAYLRQTLEAHGLSVQEESGVPFGGVNLVVGDLERAKIVFSAHYDTCASLPFPNFIAPKNLLVSLLYQFVVLLPLFVVAAFLGWLVGRLVGMPDIALFCFGLLCLASTALMFCGPANPHNANDNTSGVCVLAETALALAKDAPAAFVFFDHEELGLFGSSTFYKKHRKIMRDKPLLNFDCVSDGDTLLFLFKRRWRQDAALCEAFERALAQVPSGKTVDSQPAWRVFYPSDQAQFPKGAAVTALHHHPLIGHYLGRIHTRRDTQFDRVNIEALRDVCLHLTDSLAR